MASKSSVWRKAERDFQRLGWTTQVTKKARWVAPCGYVIACAHTPKDPDAALRQHLRLVRRHQSTCPTCAGA